MEVGENSENYVKMRSKVIPHWELSPIFKEVNFHKLARALCFKSQITKMACVLTNFRQIKCIVHVNFSYFTLNTNST